MTKGGKNQPQAPTAHRGRVDHLVEVDLGDLVGDVAPSGLGNLVPDAPPRQELDHVEQVLLLPLLRLLRRRLGRRRRPLRRRRGAGTQGSLRRRRRDPEGPPEQAHRPLGHGHREPEVGLDVIRAGGSRRRRMRAPASRCEGARRRPGLGFCVHFAEAATGPPLIGVGLGRSGPFTVDVWIFFYIFKK